VLYFIHTDHLVTPQKITDASRSIIFDIEAEPQCRIAQEGNPVSG